MNVNELIIDVACEKMKYLNKYGHVKEGCNGPYCNRETAVRNSAHWITTFSYLFKTTGDPKYRLAAHQLADFLLQDCNYGASGSVIARKDARFDKTNGLIGQAWVIEGLIRAAVEYDEKKYSVKAKELFLLQSFKREKVMWDVLDTDGSEGFDIIYNHQLWFAASGAMLLDYEYDEEIDNMISLFLDNSYKKFFSIHENGLIRHRANYMFTAEELTRSRSIDKKRKFNSFIESPFGVIRKKLTDRLPKFPFGMGVEPGYHLFDLYGFALLYKRYSKHPIYLSDSFKKALEYAKNEDNIVSLEKPCGGWSFNKFAFGYNSPAYEYPFVSKVFGFENPKLNSELLEFQIQKTYNNTTKSFSVGCCDAETMDARLYELVRFLE